MVQDNEVQKQKEPIKNDVQWANQKQEIKDMFSNKSMREGILSMGLAGRISCCMRISSIFR